MKYIIVWNQICEKNKNKPYYQGNGYDTTYNKKEAKRFDSREAAGMKAMKATKIGYQQAIEEVKK